MTDDSTITNVKINVTFPNSTVEQVVLSKVSNMNKYNVSYFLPNLPGSYTILYIGNDSENNVNKTETVTITGTDSIVPEVFDLLPVSNTNYNVSDLIEIAANVTDNYLLSIVSANITLPNSSVYSLSLTNHSTYINKYNVSYTIPSLNGQYNIIFIANDSSNNFNKTETTFFVSNDVVKPNVTGLLPFLSRTYTNNNVVEISANVTDDVGVSIVIANITYPNSSIFKLSLIKQGLTKKLLKNKKKFFYLAMVCHHQYTSIFLLIL